MTEQPAEKKPSFDELLHEIDSGETVVDEDDEVGNLAVFPDDGPKDGTWKDVHEVLEEPTEEEMEAGRKLGESILVGNDDDNGGF